MDIDDIDRALLAALLEDARVSMSELAAEVGLATELARQRVTRLEEAGVIDGYSASVDADQLGDEVTAIVRVRARGPPAAVVQSLGSDSWARSVYEVTGDEDFIVIGTFSDTDAMHAGVAELVADRSIRSISIDVVVNDVCSGQSIPIGDG